ncbi:hypothetical protein ACFX2H_042589 [Malus domestica]
MTRDGSTRAFSLGNELLRLLRLEQKLGTTLEPNFLRCLGIPYRYWDPSSVVRVIGILFSSMPYGVSTHNRMPNK